jgi:hypothetical protein
MQAAGSTAFDTQARSGLGQLRITEKPFLHSKPILVTICKQAQARTDLRPALLASAPCHRRGVSATWGVSTVEW